MSDKHAPETRRAETPGKGSLPNDAARSLRPKTRKVEARVTYQEERLMRRWAREAGGGRGALSRVLRDLIRERAERIEREAAAVAAEIPGATIAQDNGAQGSHLASDRRAA